jgi:hypothetical protein
VSHDFYLVSDVIERNETRSFGWAEFALGSGRYVEPDRAFVIAECGDSSEGNAEQLAFVTGRKLGLGRCVESGRGKPAHRYFLDEFGRKLEIRRLFYKDENVYAHVDPHKGWRPRFDETPPEVRERLLAGAQRDEA